VQGHDRHCYVVWVEKGREMFNRGRSPDLEPGESFLRPGYFTTRYVM
jgi:hypothetical protein